MEKRIGLVSIVVEEPQKSAEAVNELLSAYGDLIIGRMGLPYRKRGISLICVMVDGTNDAIGALTGKLGRLSGVSVKSVLTSKSYREDET